MRHDCAKIALFGRFFGHIFLAAVCRRAVAVELANGPRVNFCDGHIDGDVLFAGGHFFLIRPMAQLALDFDMSAFCQAGGKSCELAQTTMPGHSVWLP